MIDFIKFLFKGASIFSTLLLLGGLGLLKINQINTGDECVMDTYLLDAVKVAFFPFAASVVIVLICSIFEILDLIKDYLNLNSIISRVARNIPTPSYKPNQKVMTIIEYIYIVFMGFWLIVVFAILAYATVEFLHWILFENLC